MNRYVNLVRTILHQFFPHIVILQRKSVRGDGEITLGIESLNHLKNAIILERLTATQRDRLNAVRDAVIRKVDNLFGLPESASLHMTSVVAERASLGAIVR
jgi:hypothetical protein